MVRKNLPGLLRDMWYSNICDKIFPHFGILTGYSINILAIIVKHQRNIQSYIVDTCMYTVHIFLLQLNIYIPWSRSLGIQTIQLLQHAESVCHIMRPLFTSFGQTNKSQHHCDDNGNLLDHHCDWKIQDIRTPLNIKNRQMTVNTTL